MPELFPLLRKEHVGLGITRRSGGGGLVPRRPPNRLGTGLACFDGSNGFDRETSVTDNVVSLRGSLAPPPAQPNRTVVQELERLLEAAKAGEIVGLAGTYVHRDKVVTYSYAGSVASYGMIGGLDCVKERLLRIAVAQD
jgi:hypothetical protein